MFSLNDAILKWRSELVRREAYSGSDVEELESHLRDEIDNLMRVSLSEEEAFLVATARLGDGDVLASEFAKVNVKAIWWRRFFWMAAGVFCIYMINLLAMAVSSGIIYLGWIAGLRGYELGVAGIITKVLVLLGSGGILYGICMNKNWVYGMRRSCRDFKDRIAWGLGILVFVVAFNGLSVFTHIIMSNIMQPSEFGSIAIVEAIYKNTLTFMAPVILIVMMAWLRRARLRPA